MKFFFAKGIHWSSRKI